ncbi:c-type cytochrome [Caenispirillum salinarum]|uniref:c-type cytochrome n=1 Tax=Caenispirillum salinarum TaxID=859058 RepID=UPI00385125C2
MNVTRLALAGALGLSAAVAGAAAPAVAQQEILEKELRGLDVVAVLHAREDTMKGMKRAMSELAKMVEEEAPFDAVKAAQLAELIERNTREIPVLFPEGTQIRGSNALDAVWEEPEAFAALAEEATGKAVALKAATDPASTADDISAAFKEVALSCRACHKDYKKPF